MITILAIRISEKLSMNVKKVFGPWEQIYYAEFDGNRKKRVMVIGNEFLSNLF